MVVPTQTRSWVNHPPAGLLYVASCSALFWLGNLDSWLASIQHIKPQVGLYHDTALGGQEAASYTILPPCSFYIQISVPTISLHRELEKLVENQSPERTDRSHECPQTKTLLISLQIIIMTMEFPRIWMSLFHCLDSIGTTFICIHTHPICKNSVKKFLSCLKCGFCLSSKLWFH